MQKTALGIKFWPPDKSLKIGPQQVLLGQLLTLKRQKLASKSKYWRCGAKLSPTHYMKPKSETLQSKSLFLSVDPPNCR